VQLLLSAPRQTSSVCYCFSIRKTVRNPTCSTPSFICAFLFPSPPEVFFFHIMGDHEVAAGMPDREVQRIELRNKNKSEAMEAYYRGAVKLSLIIGAVGTAGHLIANKRCTW